METTEIIRILRQCGSCSLTDCTECPEYHRGDSSEGQGFMWSCGGVLLEAADRLELMEDIRKDMWERTNENHLLKRKLKVALVERNNAWEKIARITGERYDKWLSETGEDVSEFPKEGM